MLPVLKYSDDFQRLVLERGKAVFFNSKGRYIWIQRPEDCLTSSDIKAKSKI